ncbi:acyltransferase [Luminiphilus sp.]|nr:acyltransferase [Luminiphilus sp.]
MKHLIHLDGIRGIAVLAVFVYHLGKVFLFDGILPGGFLGVDVFFVLSGWLMTANIQAGFAELGYRYPTKFLRKRFLRLYPALIVVITSTLALSHFYLAVDERRELFMSAASSLFIVPNIYFWTASTEYFGSNPSLLLHTWSLGVEEQFYLMILAVGVVAYGVGLGVRSLFVVLWGISLAYFLLGLNSEPEARFFLTHYRLWEPLTGSLAYLAMEPVKSLLKNQLLGKFFKGAAATSMLILCGAFLLIDASRSDHPSETTLLVVLSTSLLMVSAPASSAVLTMLSSKSLIFLGRISYALYLVHWPIFMFVALATAHSLPSGLQVALAAPVSLVAAWLLTERVENPIRFGMSAKGGTVFTGGLLAASCFGILLMWQSVEVVESSGSDLDSLLQKEFYRLSDLESPGTHIITGKTQPRCINRTPETACRFGLDAPRVVGIGDSFLGVLDHKLASGFGEDADYGYLSLSVEGCPFIFGAADMSHPKYRCSLINQLRKEYVLSLAQKRIFIVTAYERLFIGDSNYTKSEIWGFYMRFISWALSEGHQVIAVSSPPGGSDTLVSQWAKSVQEGYRPPFSVVYHPKRDSYATSRRRHAFLEAVEHPNYRYVDLADLFCKPDVDYRCLVISEQGPLYFAGPHLSAVGARMAVGAIEMAVRDLP